MSTVYIILPIFNRLNLTKKCIKSFKKQGWKNWKLYIVDSASTDESVSYISTHYPEVEIIRGTQKWWWTRAVHEAINIILSTATEKDYVLLFNNDCYVEPDYLKKILSSSTNNNRAIVGSTILNADSPKDVVDCGVLIDWERGELRTPFPEVKNYDALKKVKIISSINTLPGKGTLIPVEIIKKIGNFNFKRLPHYLADYEYFHRAYKNGQKLIVSTNVVVYNYPSFTGLTRNTSRGGFRTLLELFFSRKSKINVFDYINFVLMCCPKKYWIKNLILKPLGFAGCLISDRFRFL